MVSPTAAGRTDSPTTSPSAVLPDEYRDLERYGFDLPGFYAESNQVAS